jgi:hypothetical protein
VQVTVADDRAESVRAVEALGLEVVEAKGRVLTGIVSVDALVRLAEERVVVSVSAAPA